MTPLNHAVVLLTGAAGGFGQEFTRQLLKANSRLILTDLDQTLLDDRLATLRATLKPGEIKTGEIKTGEILGSWAIDLSTPSGCEHLYQRVQQLSRELGITVDILINNAGMGLFGRGDEVPAAQGEQLMQVNLLAPMRLTTRFMADMIECRQGHIVNMASIASWSALPGLSHYCASKFGLRGFSEGLRREVEPFGVKVTTVYPFFSRTPLLQSPAYGSLVRPFPSALENWITEPATVITATLRGIRLNQRNVFPDRASQLIYWLQRLDPGLW